MPDWKQFVRQRLASLRLPPAREIEIVEELALHLEAAYEDALANGLPAAEAEARAVHGYDWRWLECELSRAEQPLVARSLRPSFDLLEHKGGMRMNSLIQDLRFGLRMLLKEPGFTLVAVITLALGIGANTAIFSVVNAVLLRPLPYADPEQLVALGTTDARNPAAEVEGESSYPDFFDWRERNQSFEAVAVYRSTTFTLSGNDAPAHLSGQVVSAELFDLLRAKPYLGRNFTRADEKLGGEGASRAAILSYGAWQTRFGANPQVIGRSLMLDRKQFQIVGVAKPGFQFPIQADPVEVWVTLANDAEPSNGKKPVTERRGYRMLNTIGRLKPGVTLTQAQADMSLLAANLEKEYPDNDSNRGINLAPLHSRLVGDYRQLLLVVFAAVGCVLLIACANVANLMLARATARYKEIAVRTALGAGRARIIRQLLTESVLLSLSGGLLGLLLGWWGMAALLRFIPEDLPRLSDIGLDRWTLGFTFLVSLLTGVVFGLAPALQASNVDLTEAMKDGARGSSASGKVRLRGALIVAEVALALMLLVSAGLLVQTFLKLQRVELGFDVHNVLTATVELPETQYLRPEQKIVFYQRLLERVRALPGVAKASAILPLPISDTDIGGGFQIEGRPALAGEEPHADMRWVNLDYYQTMKIPLVAGREFTAQDSLASPPVAIINQAFAKTYFPNEEPLGKRLELPFGDAGTTKFQIVGVVGNVRHQTALGRAYSPELYLSYAQLPFLGQLSLVVRTQVAPGSLAKTIQSEVAALDREIVLGDVKTLEQYLGLAVAQPRFSAWLFGLFALLALLLAALGLYSVMAYTVTQRTHEVGIRLALGAQRGAILKLLLAQGMKLTLLGVLLGVAGALALTRLGRSLLFGVSASDPLTFAAIALLLASVALLACYLPARRATKIDPLAALRHE